MVTGCLRFKGSDDLMRREPKTHAALSTTGAELRSDGLFHIRLTDSFKDMKRLNQECGPNASPAGSDHGDRGGRPNLTVMPDEVAKPVAPPPTPPPPTPEPPPAVPPTVGHDAGATTQTGSAPPNGSAQPRARASSRRRVGAVTCRVTRPRIATSRARPAPRRHRPSNLSPPTSSEARARGRPTLRRRSRSPSSRSERGL